MILDLGDLEADRALFEKQVDVLVATVYENERPPSGLAGLLDWRFHGAISHGLKAGAITGKIGECVYLPVRKNGTTYRLVLTGGGKSSSPGSRQALALESFKSLQKNLLGLKFSSVGVSLKDFGNPSEEFISKHLKDVPMRITL